MKNILLVTPKKRVFSVSSDGLRKCIDAETAAEVCEMEDEPDEQILRGMKVGTGYLH